MRLPIKHLQEELYRIRKCREACDKKREPKRYSELAAMEADYKKLIDWASSNIAIDKLTSPKKLSEDGVVGLQRGLSALMVEGSSFEVEEVEGEIVIKSV